MRFGVCEELYLPENDASVQKGFENAMETMKALGGAVVHVRYPNAERMREVRRIIASAELASVHRERLASNPEKFGDDVRERLEVSSRVTLAEYALAMKERRTLTREMESVFDEIDIFLAPGYPCPAGPVATETGTVPIVNGQEFSFTGLGRPQTGPYNLFGFPTMAAPSGFSADGLPVSVQIVGPPWEEARVLQVSHAFEEATPEVRQKKPPMCGG